MINFQVWRFAFKQAALLIKNLNFGRRSLRRLLVLVNVWTKERAKPSSNEAHTMRPIRMITRNRLLNFTNLVNSLLSLGTKSDYSIWSDFFGERKTNQIWIWPGEVIQQKGFLVLLLASSFGVTGGCFESKPLIKVWSFLKDLQLHHLR